MKTSRQRLLEFIEVRRVVTATEISRALKMTAANARHHLDLLEQQGRVAVIGQRKSTGRGRPAKLYGLAEGTLGSNLEGLAGALWEELLSTTPAEKQPDLLRRLARKVAQQAGEEESGRPAPVANLTQRLYAAVQELNRLHYDARWEAHAGGPRLILGHCPYARLAEKQPQFCRFDQALLSELLGTPVDQTEKLALDRRGAPYCMFAIRQAK